MDAMRVSGRLIKGGRLDSCWTLALLPGLILALTALFRQL